MYQITIPYGVKAHGFNRWMKHHPPFFAIISLNGRGIVHLKESP